MSFCPSVVCLALFGLATNSPGLMKADGLDYAYLWDRVETNCGEPQRFGTQVSYTQLGQATPRKLEHPKRVNKRRREVGLPPIETYLNEMSQMHFEMDQETRFEQGAINNH